MSGSHFVKQAKEHWRAASIPASPSTVSISWKKIQKANLFTNKMKMVNDAEAKLAVLCDRVLQEEAERRSNAPLRVMSRASTASSGAGPSGVTKKKVIKSVHHPAGEYMRPAFHGQRLSPRLNPKVGGSGSKPEHAMVLRESPLRQPNL